MNSEVQRTPNEELAGNIAAALVAAGLVPRSRAVELETGLARGTLKESDWRLLAEQAIDQSAREANHGTPTD